MAKLHEQLASDVVGGGPYICRAVILQHVILLSDLNILGPDCITGSCWCGSWRCICMAVLHFDMCCLLGMANHCTVDCFSPCVGVAVGDSRVAQLLGEGQGQRLDRS